MKIPSGFAVSAVVAILAFAPACASELSPDTELDDATSASQSLSDETKNDSLVGPSTLYPIVLFPGMAGFLNLDLGPIDISYFNGIVEDLSARGNAVFVAVAPPFDTSEVRAVSLAKQVDDILARTGKSKVNIIAHSQGGLDARVLASPQGLGYADRIASITTISTPHRGSKIADAVMELSRLVPPELVDGLTTGVLKFIQKAIYDVQTDPRLRAQVTQLTQPYMTKVFNPRFTNARTVQYMSYAARTNSHNGIGACEGGKYWNNPFQVAATTLLSPTAFFLEEGRWKSNDGAVTVESAKWGEFQQCVPADHMTEMGQRTLYASRFDHIQFFRDIAERLRGRGF